MSARVLLVAPEVALQPTAMRVVVLTPLGYPDREIKPNSRRPLRDVLFYNRWGNTKAPAPQ